jgi:hypothetical protein
VIRTELGQDDHQIQVTDHHWIRVTVLDCTRTQEAGPAVAESPVGRLDWRALAAARGFIHNKLCKKQQVVGNGGSTELIIVSCLWFRILKNTLQTPLVLMV